MATACSLPSIVRSQTLGINGTAPSNRLTVGFVGCGGISKGHLNHVLNTENLQLLSMCDVDQAVLTKTEKR